MSHTDSADPRGIVSGNPPSRSLKPSLSVSPSLPSVPIAAYNDTPPYVAVNIETAASSSISTSTDSSSALQLRTITNTYEYRLISIYILD